MQGTHTTDSGSNNQTLAAEVDCIILKETSTKLSLSDSHIHCFCHKVALIVNTGLQALSLSSKGLNKIKKATLGFVPELFAIEEDNEINDPPSDSQETLVGTLNNQLQVNKQLDQDSDDEAADDEVNTERQSGQSNIANIFKKVDLVIQKITSSAARQSEFDTWCKKLDYSGPHLIAGYGIQWNIKFQSRERAYNARHVINRLIKNKKDRQEQDNERGPNFFDNVEITRNNWEVVKKMNDTLSEFYFVTKKMEGDISSGSMMLGEYWGIIASLKKKLTSATEEEFRPMLVKMISQTDKYLNEALNCDTIILATILNPKNLTTNQLPASQDHSEYEKETPRKRELENANLFPETIKGPTTELSIYLSGKFKQPTSQVHEALQWWKPGFSDLGTPCAGLSRYLFNLGKRGEVFFSCIGHMRS
ncbi:hypothetical protein PCASD_09496 [Puccinia coronata f. sp. avenae]|uniref:HAT C-terminal dimerisation domain-containing protein n=1 Tax=Puccinia coronata f. sp. avenae TaxID=200324 RepID=A0A2N5U622_9BASI|nr:hypothetical protein PCASD_09496 [Puccinia coronata f. sp. avenae]